MYMTRKFIPYLTGNLPSFVVRTDATDALYEAKEDRRCILLNLLFGQNERTVNLKFICSNDCCKNWFEGIYLQLIFLDPEIENNYFLNLVVSLEDPFTGERLASNSISVMPIT